MAEHPAKSRNPARLAVIAPIIFWSRWISPALPPRCKYEPSCSRYAIQAIEKLGILRGLAVAAWRLMRCNPFSRGGLDRLEDRRFFCDKAYSGCRHGAIEQQ